MDERTTVSCNMDLTVDLFEEGVAGVDKTIVDLFDRLFTNGVLYGSWRKWFAARIGGSISAWNLLLAGALGNVGLAADKGFR